MKLRAKPGEEEHPIAAFKRIVLQASPKRPAPFDRDLFDHDLGVVRDYLNEVQMLAELFHPPASVDYGPNVVPGPNAGSSPLVRPLVSEL
jgi:hypothetical protein